jgi:hypothetical protein
VKAEQRPGGARLEPGGGKGERVRAPEQRQWLEQTELGLGRARHDRATRRAAHAQRHGCLAAHRDPFAVSVAGHERFALAHLLAVRAQLLQEQIDIVHAGGSRAPGGVAVVPGEEGRNAYQADARHGKARTLHPRQVAQVRQHGGQVRIIGEQRAPRLGFLPRDGPGVRTAGATEQLA